MRRIDRFDKYMEFKELNDNKVTVECGLSVGLLGKARSGKSDLGEKSIEKILKIYQDLNYVWLLTGEGEMLNTNEDSQMESDDPTNLTITDMDFRILLTAIERHGEELRKQGERMDRALELMVQKQSKVG